MRTFIAIELNEEVRLSLGRLIGRLERTGADVKWVRPATMHMTLKFLGEVDPDKGLAAIRTALGDIVAGHARFDLALQGIGTFPAGGRPRVFWAGFEDKPELRSLQADIEKGLAGLGFPPEERPFTPHLTLGRSRGPAGIPEAVRVLEKSKGTVTGSIAVDQVTLFESILGPKGAEHRIIKEYRLK